MYFPMMFYKHLLIMNETTYEWMNAHMHAMPPSLYPTPSSQMVEVSPCYEVGQRSSGHNLWYCSFLTKSMLRNTAIPKMLSPWKAASALPKESKSQVPLKTFLKCKTWYPMIPHRWPFEENMPVLLYHPHWKFSKPFLVSQKALTELFSQQQLANQPFHYYSG